MLVHMAVGDALGAGFEFVTNDIVQRYGADLEYRQHPKWKLPLGSYTDDTQMAIAIAELMLDKNFGTWTMFDVASYFMKVFMRDPRESYAQGFYKVLKRLKEEAEGMHVFPDTEAHRLNIAAIQFLSTVRPHSNKSGGAMRAAPIGLLPDPRNVRDLAMMQASLTHATATGMQAAAAAALITHYFYHRVGPKEGLGAWLSLKLRNDNWKTPWTRRVGSEGYQHVRAAITALMGGATLSEVLIGCIQFGGDVDTVAAIAMPAAYWSDELEQDLPDRLFNELENGEYGHDYLRDLSRNLQLAHPRRKPLP